MKVIISCHIDTVFKEPYLKVQNGFSVGANDNFASVLALAQLLTEPDMDIFFTEEEEMHMDGARYVARDHDSQKTFVIILDVNHKRRGGVRFTVENWAGITLQHIKNALPAFKGIYRMVEKGTESEAWLYKQLGFACVEVDIPVVGGLHSLDSKASVQDILLAAQVVKAIKDYIKDKDRCELSDYQKVGGPISATNPQPEPQPEPQPVKPSP